MLCHLWGRYNMRVYSDSNLYAHIEGMIDSTVTVYLVNGVKLQGKLLNVDEYGVEIAREFGGSQTALFNAIATIMSNERP